MFPCTQYKLEGCKGLLVLCAFAIKGQGSHVLHYVGSEDNQGCIKRGQRMFLSSFPSFCVLVSLYYCFVRSSLVRMSFCYLALACFLVLISAVPIFSAPLLPCSIDDVVFLSLSNFASNARICLWGTRALHHLEIE